MKMSLMLTVLVHALTILRASNRLFKDEQLVILKGLNATEYNGCAGMVIYSDDSPVSLNPERYTVLINKIRQKPDDLMDLPDPTAYLDKGVVLVLGARIESSNVFGTYKIKASNLCQVNKGEVKLNQQELFWYYYRLFQLLDDAMHMIGERSVIIKKIKIIGTQIYAKY
eukprot:348837_1